MLKHLYSGKVRELYRTDDGLLLLVATDRISDFDFVLDTTIPDKGKVLTKLSLWWSDRLPDLVPNHLLQAPADVPVPPELAGRAYAVPPLRMVQAQSAAGGSTAARSL